MPAMRAQTSSVYIAIITMSASSGPILVRIMLYFMYISLCIIVINSRNQYKMLCKIYTHLKPTLQKALPKGDLKFNVTAILTPPLEYIIQYEI